MRSANVSNRLFETFFHMRRRNWKRPQINEIVRRKKTVFSDIVFKRKKKKKTNEIIGIYTRRIRAPTLRNKYA